MLEGLWDEGADGATTEVWAAMVNYERVGIQSLDRMLRVRDLCLALRQLPSQGNEFWMRASPSDAEEGVRGERD